MGYIERLLDIPAFHSFFLFGARGVGKTSLLRAILKDSPATFIDLLKAHDFERFSRRPDELSEIVAALPPSGQFWVVIDEVQKAPSLLDVVHLEIEAHSRARMGISDERPAGRELAFVLTGSSARKLRRGNANLLAGRAFIRHLFPLTHLEMPTHYSFENTLNWGSLPALVVAASDEDRRELLTAYVHTYLREEILEEQLARSAPTFRKFLEIAAQQNGEPVNFAAIGRDVNLSAPTIQNYFEILEDTLLAHKIEPYHASIRKRQREAPKYYFSDLGVVRALAGGLHSQLPPHNYGYGKAFEHFIVCEIIRLASYAKLDWRFSYLRTRDNLEVDLVIERPGMPLALLEIKSTDAVRPEHIKALRRLGADIADAERICLSQDPRARVLEDTQILPWRDGMAALGLIPFNR